MTTFVIDTGLHADSPYPGWFRDLSDHMEPRDQARAYAEHLVGEVETVARLETARKRILTNLRALQHIADVNPDAFDHVLIAYADKAAAV